MLNLFLDSSRNSGSITLAAIAADESLLCDFSSQWRYVLKHRGAAAYLHMREAMPLEGAFRNWEPQMRDILVDGLSSLITEFSHRDRFRVFSCTVDLNAHTRWARKNSLPAAERLCARAVFGSVLDWYGRFPDPFLDSINLIFDQNEGFIHHLILDWKSKSSRRKWPVWGLIRSIGEGESKVTPELQAADMIAWARNRLALDARTSPLELKKDASVVDKFSAMASLIFSSARVTHCTLNEEFLALRKFPDATR